MSKRILLTHQRVALVDDEDFEWLSQWRWHYHTKGYATRTIHEKDRMTSILMHRAILCPPAGMQSDHINGDRLDNQRVNLRVCTNSQNSMNRHKRKDCSSIYKGIHWDKGTAKWRARIKLYGKRKHIGYFDDEHKAAAAYNKVARELFGEFARLNIIDDTEARACLPLRTSAPMYKSLAVKTRAQNPLTSCIQSAILFVRIRKREAR